MKNLYYILTISMMSFIYADCSELDNQEDCERVDGCEWIESDNMPGGYCTGDWEDEEEWEECSGIDNQEDCERIDGCEWTDEGCVEGDWEDDEEEWEECSDIDNQEECERIDDCEWIENDNMPGGSCTGDWEDDEDDGGDGGALNYNEALTFSLSQNYPNPFNPITTINFSVLESENISLIVYDISGKEVSKLIDGFYLPGNYNVKWNAIDYYGNHLSSGIYIYQLKTKNQILSNKMMLVR